MKKITITLLSVLALLVQAKAQNTALPCGTEFFTDQLVKNNPAILIKQAELEAFTQKYIAEHQRSGYVDTIIIPMVFHVIHAYGVSNPNSPNNSQLPPGAYGSENISDAQVRDAIKVLDQDYNHQNSDTSQTLPVFKGISANCHFEFRLARKDPYGNCTNGIEHIFSYNTFAGADDSKLDPWPRNRYLNVWVVTAIGTNGKYAGYAYYPSAVDNNGGVNSPADGVLIDAPYVGSIGTGSAGTRHALPHEVGHTMNLEHPWGGTNSPQVACGDDGVGDTPLTEGFEYCPGSAVRSVLNQAGSGYTLCTPLGFPNIYAFRSVTTASGTTDTVPPQNTGAVFGNFTANGVSGNSAVDKTFAFTKWDGGAIDGDTTLADLTGHINPNKYYSVTVSPAPIVPGVQYILNLSKITFHVQRNSTGIRTFAVRSSLDNFQTNLPASTSSKRIYIPDSNIFYIKQDSAKSMAGNTIGLNSTINSGPYFNITSPITFRFYGWNAEDSTGTFGIDSVLFTGAAYQVQNYQNFMDYSYCSTMFTNGQRDRMRAALHADVSYRDTLWSKYTLQLDGVLDTTVHPLCAPKADFYANYRYACIGKPVNFYNASWNGAASSFAWAFSNASPATANVANPVVSFNTAGWQTVKLTASNSGGSDSVTRTQYIYVTDPNNPTYVGSYSESFEKQKLADSLWEFDNEGLNTSAFSVDPYVGYNSSSSLFLNSSQSRNQDVDDAITPAIDLSASSSPMYLNFRYAYATSQLVINTDNPLFEQLTVYYSTNCGNTWTQMDQIGGLSSTVPLITAGYWSQPFVPTSSSNWALRTVKMPTKAYGNKSVRFKFSFTAGAASNNLFIDDINISKWVTSATGAEELTPSLEVFPNPTNGLTTVSFVYTNAHSTSLIVTDILGREVISVVNNETMTPGTHNYNVDASKLPKGLYVISLKTDGHIESRKLIVD